MNRKLKSFVFLLLLPTVCFCQKDSTHYKSVRGKFYINTGIGASAILTRIYTNSHDYQSPGYGISQSAVPNGMVDFGFANKYSIGAGIAYQTAVGYPYTGGNNWPGLSEDFTRLNISGRVLYYFISTEKVELYIGVRIGASYWTDKLTPSSFNSNSEIKLTLGLSTDIYTSVQVPIGIKVFPFNGSDFIQRLGLHAEAAIGTPYFIEGGLTFRIGKLE